MDQIREIYQPMRKRGACMRSVDCIVIDSVAPLPDDIRELMLSIDRLFREAEYRHAEEPDWEPPEDYFHHSKDQIRALLFIADFYPKNQLPPLR